MNISIERDNEDGEILAIYVSIREGDVHRTVEVVEGECYADEDAQGEVLGVELLAPSRLKEFSSSKDYKNEQIIGQIVKQTLETVNL